MEWLIGLFYSQTYRKLKNVFIRGEICIKIKNPSGADFVSYPAILSITEKEDYEEIKFSLPHGYNPEDIEKKWHVFERYFQKKIVLVKNDLGFCVARVFKKTMNGAFDYDYHEIKVIADKRKYHIPIVAGKDEYGELYIYDLVKFPTLLIAGLTGSGKSVSLRAVITTIIQYCRVGVELHLTDLKMSEFFLYKDIDIVKSREITTKGLKKQLKYLKSEITRRGLLLEEYNKPHIMKYNQIKGVKKENLIVFAIDEVIMLLNEKKSERDTMIEELVQIVSLGRALGIYTILAMQRPDASALAPLVKANMDIRFAFRHSDLLNSQITLGQGTKEDASKIPKDQPGRFWAKLVDLVLLQAPYLDEEVAEEILLDFKVLNNLKPVFDGDTKKPEKIQLGVLK